MKVSGVSVMALALALLAGSTWSVVAYSEEPGCDSKVSGPCCFKEGKVPQKDAEACGTVKPETSANEDASLIEKQKAAYPLDTCVVLGNKLGRHGAAVDYLYQGRLVRFCCPGCIAAFEKDPNKHLAKLDEAAKSNARTGSNEAKEKPVATVWTCTMHSEVREGKPGKCPRCGMDLVKAVADAKALPAHKK